MLLLFARKNEGASTRENRKRRNGKSKLNLNKASTAVQSCNVVVVRQSQAASLPFMQCITTSTAADDFLVAATFLARKKIGWRRALCQLLSAKIPHSFLPSDDDAQKPAESTSISL